MFWALTHAMAANVLGKSFPVMLYCAPGQPCCSSHWYKSWWAWYYWIHPERGVPFVRGIEGSFSVADNPHKVDGSPRGAQTCEGAPRFTDPHGRLQDKFQKTWGCLTCGANRSRLQQRWPVYQGVNIN